MIIDQKIKEFDILASQIGCDGEQMDELRDFLRSFAQTVREETIGEVEQLRVQLAGCLTAAEGFTKKPAKQGDYGWSVAYQKVLELRKKFDTFSTMRIELWDFKGGIDLRDEEGKGYYVENINQLEIMQFTGLTDKNGKEIYEGDVVKINNGEVKYRVDFDEKRASFTFFPEMYLTPLCVPTPKKEMFVFEVIGNIHENPDLLKEAL